jgi:S1-C subfamily serine protease
MKDCRVLVIIALSIASLSQETLARSPEGIFDSAESYTVRVSTRIEKALGDDSAGVFNGTGFVVDADRGWILTNKHVVGESPSYVQVALKGQPYLDATKVYVDPYIDLAVIQAPVDVKAAAKLDCDDLPGTGHPVGAYGHPWGFDYTGTQGVISGQTTEFGERLLQTDTPINSGNSGGPLLSMRSGTVVGISSSSYNDDDAENTNFAVPITEACDILQLLSDGRDPAPPKLDVAFYDLRDQDKLIVARSYLDPALLDVRPGDRILAIGQADNTVDDRHQLIHKLRGHLDDIRLLVQRGPDQLMISGRLEADRVRNGVVFAGMVLSRFGVRDASLFPTGHDIMVSNFLDGSMAMAAEVELYDILVRVNGEAVTSLPHAYDALSRLAPGEAATIEFVRWFEKGQFFQYLRRELSADSVEWLGENGELGGLKAQLLWKKQRLTSNTDLSEAERTAHRASINSILTKLEAENANPVDEHRSSLVGLASELLGYLE